MNTTSFCANVILFFVFAVGIPWLLLKIFRGVPYLAGLQEIKWAGIGMSALLSIFVLAETVTLQLGLGYPGDIWTKAATAVLLLTFCIVGHLKWPWLLTLYPKETLLQERKRNAQLIRKLQLIDDITPCAKFESRNGTITDANLAAMQLVGYSRHELIGMSGLKLFHPDDAHYFSEVVLKRLNHTYECRLLHKQHTPEHPRIIPVEVHSAQVPYNVELRLSFATDMTRYVAERDRRIRENHVRVSDSLFRNAAQELEAAANQQ